MIKHISFGSPSFQGLFTQVTAFRYLRFFILNMFRTVLTFWCKYTTFLQFCQVFFTIFFKNKFSFFPSFRLTFNIYYIIFAFFITFHTLPYPIIQQYYITISITILIFRNNEMQKGKQ